MATPETIRARDLHARLAQGEPIQLVDVREDQELELARLPYPVVHLPSAARASGWPASTPNWTGIGPSPCCAMRGYAAGISPAG